MWKDDDFKMIEKLKKYRRDLHVIPELEFDLYKTYSYVKKELESLGFETKTYAKTGLVAIKEGKDKKTYAFRADMDALAINEENDVSYKSKHEGLMHACGHDGHMAMLLGFANYIKDLDTKYTIMLIFQPAEESPGGAKVMIEEGLFDNKDVLGIFGLHLYPDLELGLYGFKENIMFAAKSEFDIEIKGQSAHGATPNNGKNALLAASHLVYMLSLVETIDNGVISTGIINSGTSKNVISDYAKLSGSIRSFTEEGFNYIKGKISKICKTIEDKYGVKVNNKITKLYPSVNNDSKLYNLIYNKVDNDKKRNIEVLPYSEDFSFYQQEIPGLFVFVGTKTDKHKSPLHSPTFNFDEKALVNGLELYKLILKTIEEV